MKVLQGVFATDGWSRDSIYMTARALAGGLWMGSEEGLPSNLSHDSLRPVGWSRATALLLEPGLTRLAGVFYLPDTPEERRHLERLLNGAQSKRYQAHNEEINYLRQKLSSFVLDQKEAKHCLPGGVALLEPGLAARTFPSLFALVEADKDGLVPLSQLTPVGPGVYQIGELLVFAHPFFRRSLSRFNSLNQPFLERLQRLNTEGVPAKVALDSDLVGLASTYAPHMEFEYWWGPKFDDDLASIETGSTRHEASDIDRLFYGISRTEFWWHSRKGFHSLEAEELCDAPVKTEQVEGYFCRYVHSMIDESNGQVTHFDGAVRGYSEEAMIHRLDADIKGAGRGTDYTKLWRLDSPITVAQWKGLFSDYYRDNRLVGEYLGAEPEPPVLSASNEDDGEEAQGGEQFCLTNYVPHVMESGSGIRMALSYTEPHEHLHVERQAVALQAIEVDGKVQGIVEDGVIELRKTLARSGHMLLVSETSGVLHPEDLHRDFGLIVHGTIAVEQPEIVHATLESIRQLVEAWNQKGRFGTIAFCLGFPVEERQAQVAVIGHVADVAHWLANPLSKMPTKRDELEKWIDEVAKFLRATYPPLGKQSPLIEAVTPFYGSLLKRKPIDRAGVTLEVDDTGVKYSLKKEEFEKALGLWEAVQQGEVVPAACFLVDRSLCSRCRNPYPTCGCCKSLDQNVFEEIQRVSAMDVVWSDRNPVTVGS